VITEFQTRGELGAYDEFVSLYNPTDKPVVLTSDWTLEGRGDTETSDSERWRGNSGGIVPAYGFFLIAGQDYSSTATPDDYLVATITDAGRLNLVLSGTVTDSVCFAYSSATFTSVDAFVCPGTPATNPHDDHSDTDNDTSLARSPFACTNTGDSASDFDAQDSTPLNTSSPAQM